VVNNQATVLWTHNNNVNWGLFYGTPLELPIGQFAGQTVKFHFRSYGGLLSHLGYWHIHDVTVTGDYTLDVMGGSVETEDFATVGATTPITVMVKNIGSNSASNLQVNLYQENGGLLGTNTISFLSPGDSVQTQFLITPGETGTMRLYGLISAPDDLFPQNNYTEIGVLEVYPAGYFFRRLGTPTRTTGAPVYANYRTGIHQTLYLANEIFCQGEITGIYLRSHFGVAMSDRPLQVWLYNTSLSTLPSLQSVAQATEVFNGVLDLLPREQTEFIPFTQPFAYSGANLLLIWYSANTTTCTDQADFLADSFNSNRNRYVATTDLSVTYDPLNPPAGWGSGVAPCITMVIDGAPLVNVTCRVVRNYNSEQGIASATVSLTGPVTMQSVSNNTGDFSFSGLPPNNAFQYTITAQGFQPLSGSFSTATTDCDLGNLVMTEVLSSPQNVSVVVQPTNDRCWVNWSWSSARDFSRITTRAPARRDTGSRTMTGFTIYRLQPSQEDQPDAWTMITSVSAAYRSFLDMSWNDLPAGQYIYAVTTRYNNNQESAAALSPAIDRFVNGSISGNVTDLDGTPIAGAELFVPQSNGYGPFSIQSDENGDYAITGVHYGAYEIDCSHPGYQSQSVNVTVTANLATQTDFHLTDVLTPREDLVASIRPDSTTVDLTWDIRRSPASRNRSRIASERTFSNFVLWRADRVNLDNPEAWVSLGETTECCWTDTTWYDLPNTDYFYVVKARYSGGELSVPCISDSLQHLHFSRLMGTVVNNDSLALEGAQITLVSTTGSYEAVSNEQGGYCFDSILPGEYQLQCSVVGYITPPVLSLNLIMHQTSHYDFMLQEWILTPSTVSAQVVPCGPDSTDFVLLSWHHDSWPDNRALVGFDVWRLQDNQIGTPDSWLQLNETLVTDTLYTDSEWPRTSPGLTSTQ
jgi:protocatechuate 3,4-dioxygenase beta subunit